MLAETGGQPRLHAAPTTANLAHFTLRLVTIVNLGQLTRNKSWYTMPFFFSFSHPACAAAEPTTLTTWKAAVSIRQSLTHS